MNLRFVSYIIIFVDYIIFPVKVSLSMQICFKKITLNQNISTQNYIGCLIHYFMLSFVFVSVDSLQPLLLQKQFNIQRKDQIQNFKNAFVILFDIVVKMVCAPVFGYLCDRYGRKKINMYGIICVSASMFAMPYSPSFWFYVVLRCIYATGAIAISVVPLLADYVNHKSRGTCAAFLVLMSSLGALASAYINFTLLNNIGGDSKIFYQYGVICSIIIILGLAYTCFCLKSGNDYYSKNANQRRTFKQLLAVAKKSMECPQITNGYTAAFLARGDSILLSLYLVLWTYSFYDPAERSAQVYEQAFSHASMLSGFAYLVIMLTCIIYGFYYQRKDYSRSKIMIAMLSLASVGSLLINFANTSSSFMAYMSVIVLGLGMSGLLTASLYLVNEYSTAESRGFITGIQTLFGVVGILFQTIIGALLYEYVSRSGPFNYFAVTVLVTLLITIYIYRNRKQELTNNLVEEGSILEQEKPDRDSNNVPTA